jgi:hypothetical protein
MYVRLMYRLYRYARPITPAGLRDKTYEQSDGSHRTSQPHRKNSETETQNPAAPNHDSNITETPTGESAGEVPAENEETEAERLERKAQKRREALGGWVPDNFAARLDKHAKGFRRGSAELSPLQRMVKEDEWLGRKVTVSVSVMYLCMYVCLYACMYLCLRS